MLRGRSFGESLTPNAARYIYMPISRAQGEFLCLVARTIGARRAVEFGTSFGISTIYLASAIRDNGGVTTSLGATWDFHHGLAAKLRLKPPRSPLSRGNGRGIPSKRVDAGGARLQPCQATLKGCPTATRSRLRQRAAVASSTLLTRRRENLLHLSRFRP